MKLKREYINDDVLLKMWDDMIDKDDVYIPWCGMLVLQDENGNERSICGNCLEIYDSIKEGEKHFQEILRERVVNHLESDGTNIIENMEDLMIDELNGLECNKLYYIVMWNWKLSPSITFCEDDSKMIVYSLNIGEKNLGDKIIKLNKEKEVELSDIVVGRNKNGNYTLHYRERKIVEEGEE